MVMKSLCQYDMDPKGEDACAKDPLLIGKALIFAIISPLLDEAFPRNFSQHGCPPSSFLSIYSNYHLENAHIFIVHVPDSVFLIVLVTCLFFLHRYNPIEGRDHSYNSVVFSRLGVSGKSRQIFLYIPPLLLPFANCMALEKSFCLPDFFFFYKMVQ